MKKIITLLTGTIIAVSSFPAMFPEQVKAKNFDKDQNNQNTKKENSQLEVPLSSNDEEDELVETTESEAIKQNKENSSDSDEKSDLAKEEEKTPTATDSSEEQLLSETTNSEATEVLPSQSEVDDETKDNSNLKTEKSKDKATTTIKKVEKNMASKKNKDNPIAKKVNKNTKLGNKKKASDSYSSTNRKISPIAKPTLKDSSKTTSNVSIGENSYTFSPNFTTQRFVRTIGEDARQLGQKHGLYASVMIAQAILESASGNSSLASPPNYNLFGIKGSYHGTSVNFATQEDDGSGNHFTIRANFRKYPSYKQSLEDYVQLIRGGLPYNHGFYSGVWKSNTHSYQDATRFLMGRYATDTSYAAKLNGLIKAYGLTRYDTPNGKPENIARYSSVENTEKSENNVREMNRYIDKSSKEISQLKGSINQNENNETIQHKVKSGESLTLISQLYHIPIHQLVSSNNLNSYLLTVGQVLNIGKTVRLKEEETLHYPEKYFETSFEHFSKPAGSHLFLRLNTPFFKNYSVKAYRERPAGFYSVQRGDTLAKISKRFGLSIQSLRRWNNLNSYLIYEGQQLRLTPWLHDPLNQGFITI